ncbi:hypothetical protein ACOSQ4_016805 [Xanthoceras sorbifolium]
MTQEIGSFLGKLIGPVIEVEVGASGDCLEEKKIKTKVSQDYSLWLRASSPIRSLLVRSRRKASKEAEGSSGINKEGAGTKRGKGKTYIINPVHVEETIHLCEVSSKRKRWKRLAREGRVFDMRIASLSSGGKLVGIEKEVFDRVVSKKIEGCLGFKLYD